MRMRKAYTRRKVFVDTEGCWIWAGLLQNGYGPYRKFYEFVRGAVPRGMELDHTCNKTYCVNPDHLEIVTKAEHRKRTFKRRHQSRLLIEWVESCTPYNINERIRSIGEGGTAP